MSDILQEIANELVLPLKEVQRSVALAKLRSRRFTIPKRTGGSRVIVQPAVTLKPVLSWLDATLLSQLPVHDSATAFRPDKSILVNASAHSRSKYSVRVDISNFFPSIRSADLVHAINAARGALPSWARDVDVLILLSHVCFDRDDRLPIGYSTSPSIANAVMYAIDLELARRVSDKAEFGMAVVTRYADDFVFSTDLPGACKKFVETLSKVLADSKSPRLSINVVKTRYMSRSGGSTLITGLRVNNQGNVVVHANYRDHLRLLLKLYRQGTLNAEDVPKLIGHLAYVQHVDPALFTKLSFRYHHEIERIRG